MRRPDLVGLPPLPADYGGDASVDPTLRDRHAGSRGPVRIYPRAVLRPRDAEDVASLVGWATEHGVALVPRGGATGMPGGNVGAGAALDLTGLNAVRAVPGDPTLVDAGAGAVAATVDRFAEGLGRCLPALPSSAPWCTVGGMVACNAAGARSYRHGSTRRQVAGLQAVFTDGTVRWLGQTPDGVRPRPDAWLRGRLDELGLAAGPEGSGTDRPGTPTPTPTPTPGAQARWPEVRKNSSGYALDHVRASCEPRELIVGSEGTLAIVTRVLLRTERPAESAGVCLVGLRTPGELADALDAPAARSAVACEYFGAALLALGRSATGSRLDGIETAGGALLLEFMGEAGDVESGIAEALHLGRSLGGARAARGAAEVADLWQIRHDASPAIARAAGPGRRSLQFIEDSVVPVGVLPAYLEEVEAILARNETPAVIFGHAGDGNLHVNPLVDLTRPDWRERVRAILEDVVVSVCRLGGTLSGEHGDGRLRAPFLERVWGAELAGAFAAVKRTFDPAGVLNPGVVVPLPGQDALEGFAVDAAGPGHGGAS